MTMLGHLKAAAAAGPNMASKGPAQKGMAKASDKIMRGNPRHVLHPGSSAGLRSELQGIIEHAGQGYRDMPKPRPQQPRVNIQVKRGVQPGGNGAGRITDHRMPQHGPSQRDKELSSLL